VREARRLRDRRIGSSAWRVDTLLEARPCARQFIDRCERPASVRAWRFWKGFQEVMLCEEHFSQFQRRERIEVGE